MFGGATTSAPGGVLTFASLVSTTAKCLQPLLPTAALPSLDSGARLPIAQELPFNWTGQQ